MYFFRYDGNILDFSKGQLNDNVLKLADNCFIRERKDRITLFKLKLTMTCAGSYVPKRQLDFYIKINKKKSILTCERCHFALLGEGKLCTLNSYLLPRHFHHKKTNFNSVVALLKANGYLQLPVPDPMTWSYMNFRY